VVCVRTPRLVLAAVTLAGALLSTGCVAVGTSTPDTSTSAAAPGPAGAGDPARARQELDSLAVATPQSMAGYSRDRFKTWTEQPDGCNTRQEVLKRDGKDVRTTKTCRITGGAWTSPYDGLTFTEESRLDIDHVVPLANAWRSGAKTWTDDRRTQFANDLTDPQLVAVSATANRAKGDQDPSQWKPPNRQYWCTYAENWINVKQHWQLTVTDAEKRALADMLGTC
jgi:Protein of unknown function (DUF1524)